MNDTNQFNSEYAPRYSIVQMEEFGTPGIDETGQYPTGEVAVAVIRSDAVEISGYPVKVLSFQARPLSQSSDKIGVFAELLYPDEHREYIAINLYFNKGYAACARSFTLNHTCGSSLNQSFEEDNSILLSDYEKAVAAIPKRLSELEDLIKSLRNQNNGLSNDG